MTAPATDSDRPAGRVRSLHIVPPGPEVAERDRISARARAIPASAQTRLDDLKTRTRNVASSHLGDLVDAAATSPVVDSTPMTIREAAAQVLPAKGEAGNPVTWTWAALAGLFRLTILAGAWTTGHAVSGDRDLATGRASRTRAGIGLALTLLAAAIAVGIRTAS